MDNHRETQPHQPVTIVSTTFILKLLCDGLNPLPMNQQPLWANMLLTTSLLLPPNEHQWSTDYFSPCILDTQRAIDRRQPIITASAGCIGTTASDGFATTT